MSEDSISSPPATETAPPADTGGQVVSGGNDLQPPAGDNLLAPKSTDTSPTNPTEEGKPVEGEEKEGEAKPEEVKISFDDFKLPDGYLSSDEDKGDFVAFCQESGLSKEAAQKALDLHIKKVGNVHEQTLKAWQVAIDKVSAEQMELIKADPVFGGQKFEENAAAINRWLAETELDANEAKFRQQAAISVKHYSDGGQNFGNNHIVVGLLHRLAAQSGEGKYTAGGGTNEPSALDGLYPNM